MESENMAGAEQTSEEQTGMETLAELMIEDDTPDAGASPVATEGTQTVAPTKFNDLADTLGMELNDLYKLEISQAEDGSPVTVENLKDHYAKQVDFSLHELEFEERRTKQESELMQAQEELRELMAALPEKAIAPEVLQKVRDKHEAQVQLERRRMFDVIPTWQDEQARTKDIEGMADHMKQYGFPVDYLERVVDHRQMKYIRDNWQREQRIRIALAKVTAGKPNPTSKQKPARKAPSKQPLTGVTRGNSSSKLEALFSSLD